MFELLTETIMLKFLDAMALKNGEKACHDIKILGAVCAITIAFKKEIIDLKDGESIDGIDIVDGIEV